ncbi:hypothetical protein CVIRNUC_006032 [Coccomyxa viridis]|uniref:Uncharacterized protein n=1 Tax=Coccomyxa viridis TaxID=1274662 RepID=A0AAV1I727_9CHLO|nr:hypothetical protein CVIRNUC_006032 [Coccomyxa viridis]
MEIRLVPYERQREERIKRNTDIMIQMGVLTAAQVFNEAVLKSKGSRPVENRARLRTVTATESESCSKPQRRSSRLKGEAPDVLPNSDVADRRIRTSTPAGAAPAMDSSLCSQLHEHNLYRIRTMSMNALQRRIYTIQRCDKLQSFIEVLINKHTSVPWALMAKS